MVKNMEREEMGGAGRSLRELKHSGNEGNTGERRAARN